MYIDYILKNYTSFGWKTLDNYSTDTIQLRKYLNETLQADSVFNKYFLEAVYYYVTSVGQTITDYRSPYKLKITTDSLIIIATRFFYATEFKDNGNAKWYVCVGHNGHRYGNNDNMTPLIEAFCFMAVMDDVSTEEYNIFSVFRKNINKLEKQKTDKEGEDKLEYYRMTMYAMMRKSNKLRALLIDKYNKKKNILNFELTEN